MDDKTKVDLTKLKVEVRWHEDMWRAIKNATMTTIGKDKGKYPNSEWKRKMLMGEHSPIRIGCFLIKIYNCPQFVHGHLVRHQMGITPFISTLRSDRNNYDDIPNRYTLQDGEYYLNFQAIINISRKSLSQNYMVYAFPNVFEMRIVMKYFLVDIALQNHLKKHYKNIEKVSMNN